MRGNHFDLYLGPGEKAAHQAGLMKGTAKAYVLLPRSGGSEEKEKSASGGRGDDPPGPLQRETFYKGAGVDWEYGWLRTGAACGCA